MEIRSHEYVSYDVDQTGLLQERVINTVMNIQILQYQEFNT